MGIRGELFSTRISCEGRTYFFNVKQNRMGDVFLTIVESKPTETETFDRRSIVVFREDMRGFLKAFQTTLNFMEKPGQRPAAPMSFHPIPEEPETPPPAAGGKKRRVVVKRRVDHGLKGAESAELPPSDSEPNDEP